MVEGHMLTSILVKLRWKRCMKQPTLGPPIPMAVSDRMCSSFLLQSTDCSLTRGVLRVFRVLAQWRRATGLTIVRHAWVSQTLAWKLTWEQRAGSCGPSSFSEAHTVAAQGGS